MAHVSIIGTGSMGQAIAGITGKGGHTVQLIGEGDAGTAVGGDIVVLAVPFGAVDAVIAERGDSLAGKVVVDITNPVNFETFDSLTVPADSSAAAIIASRLPKSTFAGIVTSGGFTAIDAGALARARELEAIGFLQITLAAAEKITWTGGFGVVA